MAVIQLDDRPGFMEELVALGQHYNQVELAKELGVSQSHVSMLMAGKRRPSPTLEGKIRRLHNGTETHSAKWKKPHGSATVVVSCSCPDMTLEELKKLTTAVAYYASAYMLAATSETAGLPFDYPKPLP
ncbi:MAG: helix-turn-helix transcriptional regulator [Armatimonadetes bacterium]|nr:helix-turn-helix transcriptional regulator [Armatimonadota bacterium]